MQEESRERDERRDLSRRVTKVFLMGEQDGDVSCYRRGGLSITVTRAGRVIDTVDVRRDVSSSRVDLYRYQRTAPGRGRDSYAQALYDINGSPTPISYGEFTAAFDKAYEELLVYSPEGAAEGIREAREAEKPGLAARILGLFSRKKEAGETPSPARRRRGKDGGSLALIAPPEDVPEDDDGFDALFRD